jgi:hypothetical protein
VFVRFFFLQGNVSVGLVLRVVSVLGQAVLLEIGTVDQSDFLRKFELDLKLNWTGKKRVLPQGVQVALQVERGVREVRVARMLLVQAISEVNRASVVTHTSRDDVGRGRGHASVSWTVEATVGAGRLGLDARELCAARVQVARGQLVRLLQLVAKATNVVLGVGVHHAQVLALLDHLHFGRLPLDDQVAWHELLQTVGTLVHDTSLLRTVRQPLFDNDVLGARRQVIQALHNDSAWSGGGRRGIHFNHLEN